jgi:hypothetical protein
MSAGASAAYHCAPALCWVKDAGQTILVDGESGRSWVLRGVEAAIWDLLTLGYPAGQIAPFLAVLRTSPVDQASDTLAAVVHAWVEAGIVLVQEGGDD